ncbi:Transmembrane protein adipocyte-associated 1 [Bulinus truncatus]|nr:Transmembrane protein adipocyte-associated 1 [Bulinus truncatus]
MDHQQIKKLTRGINFREVLKHHKWQIVMKKEEEIFKLNFMKVKPLLDMMINARLKIFKMQITKRLFYYYCSLLSFLNLAQAIASILHYLDVLNSLCVIDATTYVYFSFYNPLAYGVFLWKFFKVTQPGVPFSYKHHEDVMDDEHVILPYSNGAAAIKQEEQSPIYSYNSTHFDVPFSPNSYRRNSSGSEINSSFKHSVSINILINTFIYNFIQYSTYNKI